MRPSSTLSTMEKVPVLIWPSNSNFMASSQSFRYTDRSTPATESVGDSTSLGCFPMGAGGTYLRVLFSRHCERAVRVLRLLAPLQHRPVFFESLHHFTTPLVFLLEASFQQQIVDSFGDGVLFLRPPSMRQQGVSGVRAHLMLPRLGPRAPALECGYLTIPPLSVRFSPRV